MNKIVNIAIFGLGQVGIYLYNELRLKKKEIEIEGSDIEESSDESSLNDDIEQYQHKKKKVVKSLKTPSKYSK